MNKSVVDFNTMAEYIHQAAILEAILNYCTASEVVFKEDILKIAGIPVPARKELFELGEEVVGDVGSIQ